MESVGKLREADEKYRRIIFTHDMTAEDRDEYKRLVTDAKKTRKGRDFGGIYLQGERGSRQFSSLKNTQTISNIMYSNVDTLINKKHELETILNSFNTKPQIIALTETNYKNRDLF